jgi:hypothetical protein
VRRFVRGRHRRRSGRSSIGRKPRVCHT